MELLDIDGVLHAVVVTAREVRTRPVGATAEAATELEALRFALRRVVRVHGTTATRAAVTEAARSAANRLDGAVFGPVRAWLGDGELVLVPVGALHATPWALLPACRGRPVAVAPSASAWLAATGAPARPTGRPVLVGGP